MVFPTSCMVRMAKVMPDPVSRTTHLPARLCSPANPDSNSARVAARRNLLLEVLRMVRGAKSTTWSAGSRSCCRSRWPRSQVSASTGQPTAPPRHGRPRKQSHPDHHHGDDHIELDELTPGRIPFPEYRFFSERGLLIHGNAWDFSLRPMLWSCGVVPQPSSPHRNRPGRTSVPFCADVDCEASHLYWRPSCSCAVYKPYA